jgi:glycosyltransferase involved in cell wall biosynthesis
MTGLTKECPPKPVANYISNLGRNARRGGWDGINAAVVAGLETRYEINYVGPVSPPISTVARVGTFIRRVSRQEERFESFSDGRLRAYAEEAAKGTKQGASFDFFHGSTPWVLFPASRSYFAYVDAVFGAYVTLYHRSTRYSRRDLDRIIRLETEWLNSASGVFFSSDWALQFAVDEYGCHGANFHAAGVGGVISPPASDTFRGGKHFIAVTTDFERKGGPIIADGFQIIRGVYPDATLTFIGERPPDKILSKAGFEYAGYLDKSNPSDLKKLRQHFAGAFASILASSGETSPVIIAELGYFGCPMIAPAMFGIGEMIRDGETGILIRDIDSGSVSRAMLELLADEERYARMRIAARRFTLANFRWESVMDKVIEAIDASILSPVKGS